MAEWIFGTVCVLVFLFDDELTCYVRRDFPKMARVGKELPNDITPTA